MKTIPLSTFMDNMDFYISEAKAGKIFVYPTDTIYGIGGIVTSEVATKISDIKQRPLDKHYSIIAPNENRVHSHFKISNFNNTWDTFKSMHALNRGLTTILKLKENHSFPRTQLQENGVRYLDHIIQSFVTKLGEGFITTSANISGFPNIDSLDQLTGEQKKLIDYGVDENILESKPSVIIVAESGEVVRS